MATETREHEATTAQPERARSEVYRPNIDIVETADALEIVADMPGVKPETIDVNFDDGLLRVSGKVAARYQETSGFLLREYGIGNFERTFRVGEQIDTSAIQATCRDGVLTVHLPKAQAAKPRKIVVNASN